VVGPTPLDALSAPITMSSDNRLSAASAKCLCTQLLPSHAPSAIGRRFMPPDPSRLVVSTQIRA
jgi:hypothetical protein